MFAFLPVWKVPQISVDTAAWSIFTQNGEIYIYIYIFILETMSAISGFGASSRWWPNEGKKKKEKKSGAKIRMYAAQTCLTCPNIILDN